MAEKTSFGVARLRQAITNQATCGSGQFELSIDSADRLCREIEDQLDNPSWDEEELAMLSWARDVPAPRDADGEVVPLTTKVVYDDGGEELTVRLIRYRQSDGGWVAELCRPCADVMDALIKFHLHRPDSWERLEEDIRNAETGGICGYYGRKTKPCNEDCPANKDPKNPCSAIALKDVLRRAKALAGVGES